MVLGDVLLEPGNFGKYFHDLFEFNAENKRRGGSLWKKNKNGKKSKSKFKGKNRMLLKPDGTAMDVAITCAPDVEIPGNASHFAVYFAVRGAILERWMRQAAAAFINSSSAAPNSDLMPCEFDSDTEDITHSHYIPLKVPKIVGVGLRSVFELIGESRNTHPVLCTKALQALLDVIQGQSPEGLKDEPTEVMDSLFDLLLDLATLHGPEPSVSDDGSHLTALACACLLGLVVVRGDTGKLLSAIAALLMCPRALAMQNIHMPAVLASLQRSVHAILLGKSTRPDFLTSGIPINCVIDSFPIYNNIDVLNGPVTVKSMASDGKYLYLLTTKGLAKLGTGYSSSIKGYIYASNKDISSNAWIGYCNNTLYYKKPGNNPLCEINKDTLHLIGTSTDNSAENNTDSSSASVMFTDGESLGMITAAKDDAFFVRTLNSSSPLDLPLKLARKCLEVIGGMSIDEECNSANAPINIITSLNLPGDEEIMQVAMGKEFGLVRSSSGKIFYSGKSCVLGVKQPPRISNGRLNELAITKNPRINLIAVGHDGLHAVLVAEDGSVFFTGTARRGEDGDQVKSRRQPRASKPKKMIKVESHHIVHAACNNGTTALVTKNGKLLMFGKDTAHTDQTTGLVTDLKEETIVAVALGKAHTVALTSKGSVFTFGINNKGQCGREYVAPLKEAAPTAMETSCQNIDEEMDTDVLTSTKIANAERPSSSSKNTNPDDIVGFFCLPGEHSWRQDVCMICTVCMECTGYSVRCLSSIRPDRKPAQECGCGEGDSGCFKCGMCRVCAKENIEIWDLTGEDDGNEEERRKNVPQKPEALRLIQMQLEEVHRKQRSKKGPLPSKPLAQQQLKPKHVAMNSMKVSVAIEGEEQNAGSDLDRDAARVTSLAPARLGNFEKGQNPVIQLACGLHHAVLLTLSGEVYTFGSNQWGQLGTGDLQAQSGLQHVKIPDPALQVAAGSNHTVILTTKGEVYCFGNYQKGQLGRLIMELPQPGNSQSAHKGACNFWWHCRPTLLPNSGPQCGRRATWIGASGDQTFVKVDESLINANSLVKSTVVANKTSIVMIPKHSDPSFKCLVINKRDGTCSSHNGINQADLSSQVVCLDPIYGVLWSISSSNRIHCHNIVASEARNIHDNDDDFFNGIIDIARLAVTDKGHEFQDLIDVKVETGKSKVFDTSIEELKQSGLKSILNAELALPLVSNCFVSRSQAAINLLCCLDTMTLAQDQKLIIKEETVPSTTLGAPNKLISHEDYQSVHRFNTHGGGWGYSGHSIEAIRFMSDTDIILGGFGLFGGRGEYSGKIRLLDLGLEGGDQEGDGELLAETEEAPYDCPARHKHPVMFDEPVHIQGGRWYVAWARISGPSSDCGSSGLHTVLTEDQIQFSFKSSKKSNNGTDVNAGQIPSLFYRTVSNESHPPPRTHSQFEPICILTKDFARSVTKDCFQSLISLLQWSWNTFKMCLMEASSQRIGFNQLVMGQELEKLVYISRSSLRLLRSYISELYPNQITKKVPQESLRLAKCIGDVRALFMQILSDSLPKFNSKKTGKLKLKGVMTANTNVALYMSMTASILEECHKTFVTCFHAFYPTANLKWQCLCDLLVKMDKDNHNSHTSSRLLSAVLAALCAPSVRLRSTLPVLSPKGLGESCHKTQLSPSDNAGLPMISSADGHHYPILVEQMSYRSQLERNDFVGMQFKDVLDRLLDIVTLPVKQLIKNSLKQSSVPTNPLCNATTPSPMKRVIMRNMDRIDKHQHYYIAYDSENSNETNNSNSNSMSQSNSMNFDHNSLDGSHVQAYTPLQIVNQVPGLVANCSHLLARVVAELAYQSTGTDEDIQNASGRTLHCTPNRFSRSNQTRTWNTGNGSPDAICFSVDRPGLAIVGAVVYGGSGHYDYELEILDDQSIPPAVEAHASVNTHRWTSLQLVEGTLSPDDCNKDLAEIKFDKPVSIKENKKYAIRLRNHGGRTSNGDGGLTSVQGPCGATFNFSTCSLSYNGTTQARGQIPALLYYSNPLDSDNQHTSRAVLEMQAKKSTLDMVTTITHRCRDLLVQAREHLANSGDSPMRFEDMGGLGKALGDSCIVNTLLPLVFAHIVPLLGDPRSSVQVLSLIHELLPHVAALNQSTRTTAIKDVEASITTFSPNTTSLNYAWVESDHPYKPATVANYRVIFPETVKWMTLEFDPQCGTSQPEDTLQLYIPNSSNTAKVAFKNDVFNTTGKGIPLSPMEPPPNINEEFDKTVQSYWPVLHKMSNSSSQWPSAAVVLPGREVIFSLETASDYLKDDRANNYGFKCLVVGYEITHGTISHGNNGLQLLENEMAHLGGMCAASLIRRDLVLPQTSEDQELDQELADDSGFLAQVLHNSLLSRGLALSQTPTIQQALDGALPLSAHSNGRQFLRDFVSGSGGSSGARLAMWLQPESRLNPSNCQIVCAKDELRCGWPTTITIITKDQYGDLVHVPNLKVDVKAIPIDKSSLGCVGGRKMRRVSQSDPMAFGGMPPPSLTIPYEVTIRDKMAFKAISFMKAYNNYSFEELRFASPVIKRNSENMLVRPNCDGTFSAAWTPTGVGCYALSVVIDGYSMEEVYRVEVRDPPAGMPPPAQRAPPRPPSQPSRLRRFVTRPSAGLRIRAHPTLQSEQLGIVMVDGTIAFIDEIHNDDGVWLRLSMDTIKEYCGPGINEAWCLQYNQHLGRTLLLPVEQPKSLLDQVIKETIMKKTPEIANHKSQRKSHRYIVSNTGVFNQQNIKSEPSKMSAAVGTICDGDDITVCDYTANLDGTWGKLDSATLIRYGLHGDSDGWVVNQEGVKLDVDWLEDYMDNENKSGPDGNKRAYDFSSGGEASTPSPFTFGNMQSGSKFPPSGLNDSTTNPFVFGDMRGPDSPKIPRTDKMDSVTAASNNIGPINDSLNITSSPVPTTSSVTRQISAPVPISATPTYSSTATGTKYYTQYSCPAVNNSPGSINKASPSNTSNASSSSSICSVANMGSALNIMVGNSGNKLQVLHKWFKGEELNRSNDSKEKKKSDTEKPESSGSSVRDLIKALGESRVNGNGATPPETPRRARSPKECEPLSYIRSSSPVAIPVGHAKLRENTGSSPQGTSSPRSMLVQERRGSTQSDTSALVSSLTRDLSQSPSLGATPAMGRDLSPSPTNSSILKSDPDGGDSPRKLAQTGTQTSPENTDASGTTAIKSHFSIGLSNKELSPKMQRKDRPQVIPKIRNKRAISPGVTLAPTSTAATTSKAQNKEPVKKALSPSVAESLRAIFAAFLWHEGIVHDAMACASFLKFHPTLPKQGALVVTRPPHVMSDGTTLNNRASELTKEERARQRHSVEVTTADNYLQIKPSTLETLTRSAANANANRSRQRKNNSEVIKEEVGDSNSKTPVSKVISVLPPAFKSLVMLWEELSTNCLHEFEQNSRLPSPGILRNPLISIASKGKVSFTSSKNDKENKEKDAKDNEKAKSKDRHEHKNIKLSRKPTKWKPVAANAPDLKGENSPPAAQDRLKTTEFPCELCGGNFPPPVTYHMRMEHPGCGGDAEGKGYNSGGYFCVGWAGNCGEGGIGGSSWYLLCNVCREKYLKVRKTPRQPTKPGRGNSSKQDVNSEVKKAVKLLSPVSSSEMDFHIIIRNNAMFLLDLASASGTGIITNQRRLSQPGLPSVSERSPPDPAGPWAPLPPFQCFAALGSSGLSQETGLYEEELKRHSLHEMNGQRPLSEVSLSDTESDLNHGLRFHRSVSMGQGGQDGPFARSGQTDGRVIMMRRRNNSSSEMNNDTGSSLLCYPSSNLQKLIPDDSPIVSGGQSAGLGLMSRPSMAFLFQYHDLVLLQYAMKHAIRKATCRIYALQAMNWLLRSVTQPTCLHDLLWWFVSALNPIHPEHEDDDDNRPEYRPDDPESANLCEHPLTDLFFSGDLCSPLAASFHGFLQSVADLTLSLPSGSPLQMMAVRCWGIKFMPSDHAFLHRSHVFGNISKILSRSEEETNEEVQTSMYDSHVSGNHSLSSTVESIIDITHVLEIKASSRQAMVGSLTDSSTETFWESGEEDRNKAKVLDLVCSGGHPGILCVHVDNSRDIGNKVTGVSFYSGNNFIEMQLIKAIDVEGRAGTWLVCYLPDSSHTALRLELHGPDNSLRIRQIRLLGNLNGKSFRAIKQHSATNIQHINCEAETLKVFRLITSQVFGKLILKEAPPENINCSQDREREPDNSPGDSGSLDLREHMVGILFSRSKLTHLQKQVIVHIVQAIRKETIRAHDEWENSLCSPSDANSTIEQQSSTESLTKAPDTYCFEMLSMVLALSGSSVGRSYLSHQCGLLRDLFSLLHTGSARVQRQVTSLLRRMLPEITPSSLCSLLQVTRLPPKDYSIVTHTNKDLSEPFDMHSMGILDVFFACISKTLMVQVKAQSRGSSVACLAASIRHVAYKEQSERWFLSGCMARKQSEGIIALLKDMAAGKISETWAQVTKGAVAEAILNLTRLDESYRTPQKCLQTPTLWLALAALCVLDSDHVERLSSGQWSNNDGAGAPPRPTCSNHDDGETSAIIQCATCGNLCADCDRILHLHRRTRMHQRTVCKEEEEAIKVDLHEGCGRTKLFWLLALTDSATLKALVEFREGRSARSACSNTGTCRFCGATSNTGLLAIGNVCADAECQEYGRTACSKLHPCGHVCGGLAGEKICLPCLHGCSNPKIKDLSQDSKPMDIDLTRSRPTSDLYKNPPNFWKAPLSNTSSEFTKNPSYLLDDKKDSYTVEQTAEQLTNNQPKLTQDADDMCMICFTEALSCAPAIQLFCGHVFHAHCCRSVLLKKWAGPRITFSFAQCPICKSNIDHPTLIDLLAPVRELYNDVKRKALMRLEYEGLMKTDAITAPGGRYHGDPTTYAMDRYAYYVCFKCNKAYYGGEARCDAEVGENYDPRELVCGGCSDVARAQMCPKHGADFLEYKCRYCCSVAVFFCFGTTHFCNACHDDFQRVTNIPRLELPSCPAGPKARQLDGEECPLHIKHPQTGEEFALGCGVCRNAHTF